MADRRHGGGAGSGMPFLPRAPAAPPRASPPTLLSGSVEEPAARFGRSGCACRCVAGESHTDFAAVAAHFRGIQYVHRVVQPSPSSRIFHHPRQREPSDPFLSRPTLPLPQPWRALLCLPPPDLPIWTFPVLGVVQPVAVVSGFCPSVRFQGPPTPRCVSLLRSAGLSRLRLAGSGQGCAPASKALHGLRQKSGGGRGGLGGSRCLEGFLEESVLASGPVWPPTWQTRSPLEEGLVRHQVT